MTAKAARTKKASAPSKAPQNNALTVKMAKDDSVPLATAKAIIAPPFRHAITVTQLNKAQLGGLENAPGAGDYADAIDARSEAAANGDIAFASKMLTAQAITLDNIFTELARRMAANMGEYLSATETYARIALKAQTQSRAALEALAKLHQPREQTVRHVHVNEGGQAVIADEFHSHTGGHRNAESTEQPLTPGTGAAGSGTALPCPDPLGPALPVTSGEGKQTVQDARRQGQRGT